MRPPGQGLLCLLVAGLLLLYTGTLDFLSPWPAAGAGGHLEEEVKTVLLWTPWWTEEGGDWYLGQGKEVFSQCPVSSCSVTTSRSLAPLTSYSAVLFHSWQLFRPGFDFPSNRSLDQRYILFSCESVQHCGYMTNWEYQVLEDFFNNTMTFREDSDIVVPYARMKATSLGSSLATSSSSDWLDRKNLGPLAGQPARNTSRSHAVLFVSSHCVTDSNREGMVRRLNNTVRVTFRGKCAKLWEHQSSPGVEGRKGTQLLRGDFYFYLAAENSLCRDYVTEKFWDALASDVVPVVYGGGNYSRLAPPHSYINSQDFPSEEALGQYLLYLMANPKEYLEYFWWKPYYTVVDLSPGPEDRPPPSLACSLCSSLHSTQTRHSYSSLSTWWRDQAVCRGRVRGHLCNRGNERRFPGREVWRARLQESGRQRLLQLQHLVAD